MSFDSVGGQEIFLPPQSREAETACLGSCLIDSEAFDRVAEVISGPEDFYQKANQEIYSAMVSLAGTSGVIDIITVSTYLREHGILEKCGGAEYLDSLIDSVSSSAYVSAYANIVADKATARRLQQAGSAISRLALDQSVEVSNRVDQAEEIVFGVGSGRAKSDLTPIKEVAASTFEHAYKLFQEGGTVSGLPSGFKELDDITTGFHPANLIIVGARPSMGKTAFALSVAVNAALNESRPAAVAIFSLEMSSDDLCMRMMCSLARVNAQSVRKGRVSEKDWSRLTLAVSSLSSANIFIDDQGGTTVLEMKAKLRRMKKRSGLDLVIIDYLQLIRGSGRVENRVNEISEISRQLKSLAKELHVPIIALSQVSRQVESRDDKRPKLADLRESGAIEQDADLVAFLYRDEYYNKQSKDAEMAEVIIAKHRNGPIGSLKLSFKKNYGGFYNLDSAQSSGIAAGSAGAGQAAPWESAGDIGGVTVPLPSSGRAQQAEQDAFADFGDLQI